MLSIVLDFLPLFLSFVSLIIHFFVFHRLKCSKDLLSCLKEHFPSSDLSKSKSKDFCTQEDYEILFERFLDTETLVKKMFEVINSYADRK